MTHFLNILHVDDENKRAGGAWIFRLVFVCLLSAVGGWANTVSFVHYPSTISTDPDYQITFITNSNHTMEIQVQNLVGETQQETQAISSVNWLLDAYNTGSTTGVVLNTSQGNGDVITITNKNPVEYSTSRISDFTVASRWQAYTPGGGFNGGITALSGGQPSQLILGPKPYFFQGGSFDNFTPFFATQANAYISFTVFNSAITSSSSVQTASLSFGTTQGGNLVTLQGGPPPPDSATPEPGTVALSLAGIALICVGRLRRRRVE